MQYRKSQAKEAARERFRGVWAAITTPFTADGEVDEVGLRRDMRHLTDGLHVEGVFCTGVMGEFWSLTKEERKRIVEIVVEEARGKCQVIAHTAHHSAHETVELTRHAQEVGADFAVLVNPYYPPVNEAMVYEWWRLVSDRTEIGIWMFDTSYSSSYGYSVELTGRIADLENVCGLKLRRSAEHYQAVRRLCGDRIVMSTPTEGEWLTLMREHGQRVHMSSPVPYLYQTPSWLPMREYGELGLAGRYDEAQQVAAQLEPLRALHHRWIHAPWLGETPYQPIARIKAWAGLLGMSGGPVRPPLLNLPESEIEALRAELETSGLLARAAVTA